MKQETPPLAPSPLREEAKSPLPAWPKRGRVSNWSPLSSPFAGDLEQRLLELQDLIERDRGRDFYLEVLQQRVASLFVRRGASRESPPPSMLRRVTFGNEANDSSDASARRLERALFAYHSRMQQKSERSAAQSLRSLVDTRDVPPVPPAMRAPAMLAARPSADITTVMVKNLPNQVTSEEFRYLLSDLGYQWGLDVDLVYMPRDVTTCANLGYAFVNFKSQSIQQSFWQLVEDRVPACKYRLVHKFSAGRASQKELSIAVAKRQGAYVNADRFLKNNTRERKPAGMAVPLVPGPEGEILELSEDNLSLLA